MRQLAFSLRAPVRACFLFALLVIALVKGSSAAAQQLSVGAYHLQSSVRVSETQYDYTYTADVNNAGAALQGVVGTVTSSSPNTLVTQGKVAFGSVAANNTTTSTGTFTIRQDRRYSFSRDSLSWTFNQTSKPTAKAGSGQTVKVGQVVHLDGTGSTDPNGRPLSYMWTLVSKPKDSIATLSDDSSAMPTFTADKAGDYMITLVVSDGAATSDPSTVKISTSHTAPIAEARISQKAEVGDTVQLDGSASTDPDGNSLTYEWKLTARPAGSTAVLSSATAIKPIFTADKFGTYTAQLTVSDGFLSDTSGPVSITISHTTPVADAGTAQKVDVGTLVTLDGSGSHDPEGFPLTYAWSLISKPSGSTASLSNATSSHPTFIVDKPGDYVAQLIVNDGYNNSLPVTVTISTHPLKPVANAGPAQDVPLDAVVQLDGTGSTDPNGLALTYAWTFISKPAGSTASFSSATSAKPTFKADKTGVYVAQLIVNDGFLSSEPKTVAITAGSPTPIANAGPDQTVAVGDTVHLTGLASSDPSGHTLTYKWTVKSSPGAAPELTGATTATPSFVASAAGAYVLQLVVNNGSVDSAPKTVTITAVVPTLTFSPTSLSFPNQAIGTSSSSKPVLVTNTGKAAVTFTNIGATGDFSSGLVSACGGTLNAGASCTVSVVFSPSSTGSRTGALNFYDDALGAPQSVALSGNGTAGVATKLVIGTQPTNTTAAARITPAITVKFEDANGNVVTSANGVVTLSIGAHPSGATLSGTVSATAVSGVATFANLSIDMVGTGYTLIASASGLSSTTTNAFNITGGTVTKLAFGMQPHDVAAGATLTPPVTVLLQDAGGNTVTSSSARVTLALGANPVGGTLAGTLTVNAVNGVATFPNLSLPKPGNGYSLTASSSGLATVTTSIFSVTSGKASKLVFTVQPSTVALGSYINPAVVVTVEDAAGNPVVTSSGVVNMTLAANPGSAGISGTVSLAIVNGIAKFSNLSISKIGTGYTLLATSTGLTSATSSAFDVTPGPALKLAFTTQPSNTPAGATISPALTVTVQDSAGDTITDSTAAVTISILDNPSSASLAGTLTVHAVKGVATFPNLSLSTPGNGFKLSASASGLSSAASSLFNVTAGAATKLVFTTQPVTTAASATLSTVQVSIEDASGAVVTTANNVVSLALGMNPSGGSLGGTVSAAAVNGVATFSSLNIKTPGAGYTLVASASGLAAATSRPFDITGAQLTLTPASTLVGIGSTLTATVTLTQPAPAGGTVVHLTSSNPALVAISAAQITIPANSTSGQFTFTGVAAGSSLLSASIAGGGTASVQITATASLISLGALGNITVGQTVSLPLSLGTKAPTGGVTVHFTSSNPSVATVTPSVFIPAGQTIASTNPQITALAKGTTQINASATDFAPNSEGITVVAPLATLTPSPIPAHTGLTTPVTLTLSAPAPAGGTKFTLSTDNAAIATVPASVTVPAGSTNVVFNVTGIADGSTTLRANSAGITEVTAPVNVTTAPTISVASLTIGNDMVAQLGISLAAAPTSNQTLTLTSSDPTHFLLSTSSTSVGSASITVPLVVGSFSVQPVYLEGRNFAGNAGITASITASAPGYSTSKGAETLFPSGFGFSPNTLNTTAFSSNTTLNAYLVVLNPGSLTYYTYGYALGPQAGPVSISVASSNTAVGTIVGSPVTFAPGTYVNSSVAFHPVASGTTNLTLTQPAGFASPTGTAFPTKITATVTSSAVTVNAVTIGNNMIGNLSLSLSAAPPAAETLTLTSSDPTHFLLSTSSTAVGSASVTVQLTAGSFNVPPVYIEGQHYSGNTAITGTVTATASGYGTGTGTATLYPSGFGLSGGTISTTAFSSDTALNAYLVVLNPGTLTYYTYGYALGPQAAPVSLSATSSNTSVGTIKGSPTTLAPGSYSNNSLLFHPVGGGTSTITLNEPDGYAKPANGFATSVVATVTAPSINLNTQIIGNNTISNLSLSLGAAPPTAETLTVTSSDPTHFLLSTSQTSVGSASVTVPLAAGSSAIPAIYVEGQNYSGNAAISGKITASASGYTAASNTETLYPSGFGFTTATATTTTFSADTSPNIYLAVLNPGTLSYYTYGYALGPQAGQVKVPVVSSSTTVGTVAGNPGSIPSGAYYVQGLSFHAVSAGTTDLTITQPAGFVAPSSGFYPKQTVTVTAPALTFSNAIVGNGTYSTLSVQLGAPPPSNESLTVTSSDPTHFLLATSQSGPGAASITVQLTAGTYVVPPVYVQGQNFSGNVVITGSFTAKASGYSDGHGTANLYPTGLAFLNPSLTTSLSSNLSPTVYLLLLNPGSLTYYTYGEGLGPQAAPIPVKITSSNPAVGTITGSPSTLPVGYYSNAGVTFHPVATGTANLTLTEPSGYFTPSDKPLTIPITVTP